MNMMYVRFFHLVYCLPWLIVLFVNATLVAYSTILGLEGLVKITPYLSKSWKPWINLIMLHRDVVSGG